MRHAQVLSPPEKVPLPRGVLGSHLCMVPWAPQFCTLRGILTSIAIFAQLTFTQRYGKKPDRDCAAADMIQLLMASAE